MTASLNKGPTEASSLKRQVAWALVFGIFIGAIYCKNVEYFTGYAAILVTSVIPAFIWLSRGASELPILPLVALSYFQYFAVTVLSGRVGDYTSLDVLQAGLTVAAFLGTATLSWRLLIASHSNGRARSFSRCLRDTETFAVIVGGFVVEIIFLGGVYASLWGWLGSAFGLVRAAASSAVAVSCFLFGRELATRDLTENSRVIALVIFGVLILLQLISMFLHATIICLAAALIGYVLVKKRLPWTWLIIAFVSLTIFHSGKGVMRERYWGEGAVPLSITDAPVIVVEWFGFGIAAIVTGQQENTLLDRASQLSQILLVQTQTPDPYPFLGGATYEHLPEMFLPRFLVPNKVESQVNLSLLSMHYRLQTTEDTATTTLAWNIVPEAYANFGYFGIFLVALLFGSMIGALTAWSSGAPPLSLRFMIGIASLVTFSEVEYDLSYLVVCLWQTIAGVGLFYYLCRAFGWVSGESSNKRHPLISNAKRSR
jgi:hypothetical protein